MEEYSVLMSLYYKENPDNFRLALESVIHQTVPPDEIVLVEDGTLTEGLYIVIDEYLKNYPNLFHVVENATNLGLGLALNKGLLACRNNLVARMDTDDICVLDRCEKQLVKMQQDKELSVVGGQIKEFIGDIDNVVGKRIVPCNNQEIRSYMKRRCPFNHMTVMLRKSDVLQVGNYQDWFWNEDYYLWIRLAMANKKFANLPDILVRVRTGKEMYGRRGGLKYFRSEAAIQKLMLSNKMISFSRYCVNVGVRFIMQILMPNRIRGGVFRLLARER